MITAKDNGGNFTRELPPAGATLGMCWNVFDVGYQPNQRNPNKPVHKIVIYWEIDVRYKSGDFAGKRMLVSATYTLSLSEKAYLRRDLEHWRGRPFTAEELKGFDVEKVKGVPCLLNIVYKTANDGQAWANVEGVMKPPKNANGEDIYKPFAIETPSDFLPLRVQNMLAKKVPEPQTVANGMPSNDEIPF